MMIALHMCAHTTPAVRAEIAASTLSAAALAQRYGISQATVYKWKKRSTFTDCAHTAHRLQTTLTPAQERVVAQAALLLPKAPRRRQSSRKHEGRVAVGHSDRRWCSDGLEIKCDSGQTVTATFAKDCCDREVIAWRAWEGKGLPGEPVREMLIEAVEKRFGSLEAVPADHWLEFLSDNGSAYRAADTRAVARSLGLKPINTPVCSPQSNGMAESFVHTFKRDYVARMALSDAATVLAQLPNAFEHFNEMHPHSSLKIRSPREFRRHQTAQARQSPTMGAALRCE